MITKSQERRLPKFKPRGSLRQHKCRIAFHYPNQLERKAVANTKRRIEITTDRSRLIVLKRSKGASAQWCSVCSGQIVMLTTDEAATIANVSSRTIYSRAEAGEIHFVETPEGHLLICANSILDT